MAITTFEAVRAEALFVSYLQCSQAPKSDEVRAAVATTLRRVGIKGCAIGAFRESHSRPGWAASMTARAAWSSSAGSGWKAAAMSGWRLDLAISSNRALTSATDSPR